MEGQVKSDLNRPRSATELLGLTFELYGRYPWLFPTLAAGVVVPYVLVMLLVTGNGPLRYGHDSFAVSMVSLVIETVLVGPLVSALHVHAVSDVRDGTEPQLTDVARRGLIVLPLVSAVVLITTLATFAGYIALIVPGILLTLRWSVVAQSAAVDGGGWKEPLRRSRELTRGNYLHIIGLGLLALIVTGLPGSLIEIPFRHSDTTVFTFLLGTLVQIVQRSFTALSSAVLFFELKARAGAKAASPMDAVDPPVPTKSLSGLSVPPTGHPLDPHSWSDEDRPPGWYIDPNSPRSMYYWGADGTPTWSTRRAKTPRAVRSEFVKQRAAES